MKSNATCTRRHLLLSLFSLVSFASVSGVVLSERQLVDVAEKTAKLLIGLDLSVEKALQSKSTPLNHLYFAEAAQVNLSNVTEEGMGSKEEKFTLVLLDLVKIEETIKEAISKANANRQFRLVMRLRPLLSYMTHIRNSVQMLRTRVVAISTLSNLGVTVTEVLDQFTEVMSSSLGLGAPSTVRQTTVLPSVKSTESAVSTLASSTAVSEQTTTLPYAELEQENYLKSIISENSK